MKIKFVLATLFRYSDHLSLQMAFYDFCDAELFVEVFYPFCPRVAHTATQQHTKIERNVWVIKVAEISIYNGAQVGTRYIRPKNGRTTLWISSRLINSEIM